ncbi:hypothetical protein Trydic_g10614 [Trypoxylus dichotomus]
MMLSNIITTRRCRRCPHIPLPLTPLVPPASCRSGQLSVNIETVTKLLNSCHPYVYNTDTLLHGELFRLRLEELRVDSTGGEFYDGPKSGTHQRKRRERERIQRGCIRVYSFPFCCLISPDTKSYIRPSHLEITRDSGGYKRAN